MLDRYCQFYVQYNFAIRLYSVNPFVVEAFILFKLSWQKRFSWSTHWTIFSTIIIVFFISWVSQHESCHRNMKQEVYRAYKSTIEWSIAVHGLENHECRFMRSHCKTHSFRLQEIHSLTLASVLSNVKLWSFSWRPLIDEEVDDERQECERREEAEHGGRAVALQQGAGDRTTNGVTWNEKFTHHIHWYRKKNGKEISVIRKALCTAHNVSQLTGLRNYVWCKCWCPITLLMESTALTDTSVRREG